MNLGKSLITNKLGYGITKQSHRFKNPYRVFIHTKHVGVFPTLEKAVKARNEAYKLYFGKEYDDSKNTST